MGPPVAKRVIYSEDRPLTSEITAAIGTVTTQWGHLEDNVGIIIAVLIGADPYDFRAVTANMIGRSKFEALKAVADIKLPPRKARTLADIADRAISLSRERNRVIHGSWYPIKNRPTVAERYNYRAKGSLERRFEEVSAARLLGFSREVAKLVRRCNRALSRLGYFKSLRA
jgi:hypothetical protein